MAGRKVRQNWRQLVKLSGMGTALITGASAGIGAELAKVFADHGHTLILVARRRARLEDIASALKMINAKTRVHVIEQDLSRAGAGVELFAKLAAEKLPPVDFLVNNAGFGNAGRFWEVDPLKELELIDLNVRALYELTRLFLPSMVARSSGRVLMVGSTAGYLPGPYMANYYASKAYVNSLSEALSTELEGTGVTCTLLAPGATASEFAGMAGIGKSRLFALHAMPAAKVAALAYHGMMRGRRIVITGWLNVLMMEALRMTPRRVAAWIAGYMNRNA